MEDKEMTEEEYLDNLLRQASAEAPESASFSQEADSGDSAENAEVTEEAVEENAEEAVEGTTEETVEENAEEAVEEATEEAVEENAEEAVEETSEEAVAAPADDNTEQEKNVQAAEAEQEEAAVPDFDIDAFIAGMTEEEEQLPDINSEQQGQTAEAKDDSDIFTEDYHRPLDMVIDEIENDRHDNEANAADLSGNTGISAEELNEAGRDEEDSSLMEAVGLLMGEEAGKRADNNEFPADGFNFDDLYDAQNEAADANAADAPAQEKSEKQSVWQKIKQFLIEQGEDDETEEELAAKAAKKEEKAAAAEEKRKIRNEKKAAGKEKAAEKKAARKEARESKALERKVKREQKKAEREDPNEPRYTVTIVKFAFLFTVVAAFGIILWAVSDYNYRRVARKNATFYFINQQYEQAYEEIEGITPRKSDMVLYEQIRTVMYVQKQYNSYLNYYNMGMKEEALNSLLKGIDKYDKYRENADELGILKDMDYVMDKIYEELSQTFGLTKEKAQAIVNIEDSADYSLALRAVLY